MPWKASTPVDLRKEFIVRLGRGERVTDLCREYGIARKTGEKFKRRFRDDGVAGSAVPLDGPGRRICWPARRQRD